MRYTILPALLRSILSPAVAGAHRPIRSVVCIRPGKLGDMFMATPLFSALKRDGGIERLSVICSPANEPVVRHNPHIDERRVVDFHRPWAVMAAIGWMRRQRFDAVIDLTPEFSRTNFFMCYGAGQHTVRAGIGKGLVAGCYHVHPGKRTGHLADRFLEAGEALTGKGFAPPYHMELFSSNDDKTAASAFLSRLGRGHATIAINLSSGAPLRQWSYDRFAALLARLGGTAAGMTTALIAVGEQRAWAERLARENRGCFALPALPFLVVTEIIAACRLLVSADTAPAHAAAARGVPLVALYSGDSENFDRWRPYHAFGAVLRAPDGQGVNGIDPDAVAQETLRLLNEIDPAASAAQTAAAPSPSTGK